MLKLLPPETRNQLRSSVAISSPSQCVDELVLNSLDAGATCVAVRVDLSKFWIQVVDNGAGISENDLQKIGTRYMTSKCHSLDDLENLQNYGYRGEALASIREISRSLEIQTRVKSSSSTFSTEFIKNNLKQTTASKYRFNRPSCGTTVTVNDLFHSLPVRKKCFGEYLELERIRERLEAFFLIHPKVSFSLRNDAAGLVLVQSRKSTSTLGAFTHLFGCTIAKHLSEISREEGSFKISGYIGKEGHTNRNIQFVFVNGRLVLKCKIHKILDVLLSKSLIVQKNTRGKEHSLPTLLSPSKPNTSSPSNEKELYPVFVVRIDCPFSEYDITFDPAKTLVEFRDWAGLSRRLESLVVDFLQRENLLMRVEKEGAEKCSEELSQDHLLSHVDSKTAAVTERITASSPSGYANGISSYDRSNCLASSTARRTKQRVVDSKDESEGGLVDESSTDDISCVHASQFQENSPTGLPNVDLCHSEGVQELSGESKKENCQEKAVKEHDRSDHTHSTSPGGDTDTLPTPKEQVKDDVTLVCCHGARDDGENHGKDAVSEAANHMSECQKNSEETQENDDHTDNSFQSQESVSILDREDTQEKSKASSKNFQQNLKRINRRFDSEINMTEADPKVKKSKDKYADIPSTESDKTPDYSVDLPTIHSRKKRKCKKKLSYPSPAVSSKTISAGRPGRKRRSGSERKRRKSSKKKSPVPEKGLPDDIPFHKRTKRTKTDGKAKVASGFYLESPRMLFRKRTRTSNKGMSGVGDTESSMSCAGDSESGSNDLGHKRGLTVHEAFKIPDPVDVRSRKYVVDEESDMDSDVVVIEETSIFEDENPLKLMKRDVGKTAITSEVSTHRHSSLHMFRHDKFQAPLTLPDDTSGGSQGRTETVKTSRLWRRIRKMYKKTPAFLKYRTQESSCRKELIFSQRKGGTCLKTNVMEARSKQAVPDFVESNRDDRIHSKYRAKQYKSSRTESSMPKENSRSARDGCRQSTVHGRNQMGFENVAGDQHETSHNLEYNNKSYVKLDERSRKKPLTCVGEPLDSDCTIFKPSRVQGPLEFSPRRVHQAHKRQLYRAGQNNQLRSCTQRRSGCSFDSYEGLGDKHMNSHQQDLRCRDFEMDSLLDVTKPGKDLWRKSPEASEHDRHQFDVKDPRPVQSEGGLNSGRNCDTRGIVHKETDWSDSGPLQFGRGGHFEFWDVSMGSPKQRRLQSRLSHNEGDEQVFERKSWLQDRENVWPERNIGNLYPDTTSRITSQSSRSCHTGRNFPMSTNTVDPSHDGRVFPLGEDNNPYFQPLWRIPSNEDATCGTCRDFEPGRSILGHHFMGKKVSHSVIDDQLCGISAHSDHNRDNFTCRFGQYPYYRYSSREMSDNSREKTPEGVSEIYRERRSLHKCSDYMSDLIKMGWLPRERNLNDAPKAKRGDRNVQHSSPLCLNSTCASCVERREDDVERTNRLSERNGGGTLLDHITDFDELSSMKFQSHQSTDNQRDNISKGNDVEQFHPLRLHSWSPHMPHRKVVAGDGWRFTEDVVSGRARHERMEDRIGSSSERVLPPWNKADKEQRHREVLLPEDWGIRFLEENTSDKGVGDPEDVFMQTQRFHPVLGSGDSEKLHSTQAFDLTITDDTALDRGEPVRFKGFGQDDPKEAYFRKEKPSQAVGIDKMLEERETADPQVKDDGAFLVYTPDISDIIGGSKVAVRVASQKSQPQGKKVLLQRYEEETGKSRVPCLEVASFVPSAVGNASSKNRQMVDDSMNSAGINAIKGCDSKLPQTYCQDGSVSCSVRKEEFGLESNSTRDAGANFKRGSSKDKVSDTDDCQMEVMHEEDTEKMKTPESDDIIQASLSDILLDIGFISPMSDTILKKQTPEWLKCSQDMLTQYSMPHSRMTNDVEASQSILRKNLDDRTSVLCREGSEDLFSTWPTQPAGTAENLVTDNKSEGNEDKMGSTKGCSGSRGKDVTGKDPSKEEDGTTAILMAGVCRSGHNSNTTIVGLAAVEAGADRTEPAAVSSGKAADAAHKENCNEREGCCAYTCMIDPRSGRTLYVHLASGNTSYEKPKFMERQLQLPEDAEKSKKAGLFTQHPFLSHDAAPVMPRPRDERKAGVKTAASEKMTTMFDEHKGRQDSERDVKWRPIFRDGGICENLSGCVTKMLAEWDSSASKRSLQEVMSIEMSGEHKSAPKVYSSLQSFKFTKDMFQNIKVIEQVDQKFIACLMGLDDKSYPTEPQLLVFIDQHAAHERVRLEKLISDLYDTEENLKSYSVKPPLKIQIGTQQVRTMAAKEAIFKKVGINFQVERGCRDRVIIESVPKCLCKEEAQDKKKQVVKSSSELEEAVTELLHEQVETLHTSSGASGTIPKPIWKLLCSKACHGAVKFGDALSNVECENLIVSLSTCKLPFQCAHGRPSMIPIIDLRELDRKLVVKSQKPNLKGLRKRMERDKSLNNEEKAQVTSSGVNH